MATPTKKDPAIELHLNMLSGIDRNIAIHNNICVRCENLALDFDDDLSEREFSISGFCQQCQNEVFTDG